MAQGPLEFYIAGAFGTVRGSYSMKNGVITREIPSCLSVRQTSNYPPKEIPLVTSARCLQVYGCSLSRSSQVNNVDFSWGSRCKQSIAKVFSSDCGPHQCRWSHFLRLHSKSRLTLQEFDRLEAISTTQEKKKQFYRVVLADKGSAAYKDILEVLNDTASYKPHVELADKLKKCHKCLWRRLTQGRPDEQAQTEEASTASIKTGEETTTACSAESIMLDSDDGSDVDEGQLPDILRIETTAQTNQSRKVLVKVSTPAAGVRLNSSSHRATDGPAANVVFTLSMGSQTSFTHMSSSIQNSSDHTLCQQCTSAKVMSSYSCTI